jgi:hypothetical protein
LIGVGSIIFRELFFHALTDCVVFNSSAKVFHWLQPGHLPIHLGLSKPQERQKNADFVLAI